MAFHITHSHKLNVALTYIWAFSPNVKYKIGDIQVIANIAEVNRHLCQSPSFFPSKGCSDPDSDAYRQQLHSTLISVKKPPLVSKFKAHRTRIAFNLNPFL